MRQDRIRRLEERVQAIESTRPAPDPELAEEIRLAEIRAVMQLSASLPEMYRPEVLRADLLARRATADQIAEATRTHASALSAAQEQRRRAAEVKPLPAASASAGRPLPVLSVPGRGAVNPAAVAFAKMLSPKARFFDLRGVPASVGEPLAKAECASWDREPPRPAEFDMVMRLGQVITPLEFAEMVLNARKGTTKGA